MDSPGACDPAFRGSLQHSGAKRPRPSEVEFDVKELMEALDVTDTDLMVLGIDEAGRGPVAGPMVYTGAMISLAEHDDLVRLCHVADSKQLNLAARNTALASFSKLKTFQSFTVSLTAEDISKAMLGRHGQTLNTISHDTAIDIIRQATLAATGKLCAVYVDTVGPPESYQARLSGRFPHLRCTVAKRADSKFPIVSAASIVAKTTRDDTVKQLGVNVGSGYPSDPAAMQFVRSHLHRFFVFEKKYNFIRQSWGPVLKIAADPNVCCPVEFEQDIENENKTKGGDPNQPKLSFSPSPMKKNPIFSHVLQLHNVEAL
ncbi:Ribonuclease HII, putative [Angomonas deanei]|uniref:Ribonuclease n=1 Tax=Angomonas deanei TaxID=59799 RepID=A0A7G2C374_9TRYP|nr:Ribonuclease HII, putative [Angomonas deanei]